MQRIPASYVDMLRAVTTIPNNSGGKWTPEVGNADIATSLELTCQEGCNARMEPAMWRGPIAYYIPEGTNVNLRLGSQGPYIQYVQSANGQRQTARVQLTDGN